MRFWLCFFMAGVFMTAAAQDGPKRIAAPADAWFDQFTRWMQAGGWLSAKTAAQQSR